MQLKIESKVLVCFEDVFKDYYEYASTGMLNEVSPLQLLAESASVLFYNRMKEANKWPAIIE